jgi:hypothetical protein
MAKKQSSNDNAHNPPACCGCGCDLGPATPSYCHHHAPTNPHGIKDPCAGVEGWVKPTAGPADLEDFRRLLEESDPGREAPTPRVGDLVQVTFRVREGDEPWLPGLYPPGVRFEGESMWVRVTALGGSGPETSFQGELWDVPLLLPPRRLHPGSRVTFQPRHVHTVVPREQEPPAEEEAAPDPLLLLWFNEARSGALFGPDAAAFPLCDGCGVA